MEEQTKLTALDERVGKNISKLTSFDEVMHEAGFDFNVESVNCHTPEGQAIKNRFIIRREDNKKILGHVGSRYHAVPNYEMFRPFHRMVKQYGATYESAGLIDGGKKCWIAAVLPDSFKLKNRPDDEIQQRIMALVANDGLKRNAYLSVANRLFCNNQIGLINRRADQSDYKISHTKNWEPQLIDAQLGFENALALHKEFEANANILDGMEMDIREMRGFTTVLLPENTYTNYADRNKKRDKDQEKRKTNRLNNRREELVHLFTEGAGNRGITRWDALNAVTEYQDHHNQIKKLDHKKNGYRNAEKRFVSNVIGGLGDNVKQRAVDLLLNTKKFPKVAAFA